MSTITSELETVYFWKYKYKIAQTMLSMLSVRAMLSTPQSINFTSLGLLRSLTAAAFSTNTIATRPYYDSQSARWITPHDPEYFRLSVDLTKHPKLQDDTTLLTPLHERHTALQMLGDKYSTIVLPPTPILQNNNNIEAHSTLTQSAFVIPSIFPYHASTSAPDNVMFDVSVDAEKADVESILKHVGGHFSKANRVRCTISNFKTQSPVSLGSLCGKLCDAGSEEIFLFNEPDCDTDDLVEMMEEICYVDAPGGPMLGRLGLNYSSSLSSFSVEEFLEEAVFNFGCSKLKVSEEDVAEFASIIQRRGLKCDIKE